MKRWCRKKISFIKTDPSERDSCIALKSSQTACVFLRILLLALVVQSPSCSDQAANNTTTTTSREVRFPAFTNFPEKQFEDLSLGMETDRFKQTLQRSGFDVEPQTDSNQYYRSADSTLIILSGDQPIVKSFKVFLYAELYRTGFDDLTSFLGEHAHEKAQNHLFASFQINGKTNRFGLTIFLQPDFIRLLFTLKYQ